MKVAWQEAKNRLRLCFDSVVAKHPRKGKPLVRVGRKATDLGSPKMAGLPKEVLEMKKRVFKVFTALLLVGLLFTALAPAAYAGGGGERFRDRALFQPGTGAELEAGGIKVVVPPHALERRRLLRLRVFVRDGQTVVRLGPELEFEELVLIDFGTAPVVYYWDNGEWGTVETVDADLDGEVGEILSDHFSRYAWW